MRFCLLFPVQTDFDRILSNDVNLVITIRIVFLFLFYIYEYFEKKIKLNIPND